jgi:hypothetical protein
LECGALDAVEHALVEGKDARLGFEILKSIGVVPSVKEGVEPPTQEPINDQDSRVRDVMVRMASIAIRRHEVFGVPLPDTDKVEREMEMELARREKENE